MKKTVKRLLALILTIMMVLSLNGFSVLADAAAESAAESVVGSAEEDAEALAKQAEEEAAKKAAEEAAKKAAEEEAAKKKAAEEEAAKKAAEEAAAKKAAEEAAAKKAAEEEAAKKAAAEEAAKKAAEEAAAKKAAEEAAAKKAAEEDAAKKAAEEAAKKAAEEAAKEETPAPAEDEQTVDSTAESTASSTDEGTESITEDPSSEAESVTSEAEGTEGVDSEATGEEAAPAEGEGTDAASTAETVDSTASIEELGEAEKKTEVTEAVTPTPTPTPTPVPTKRVYQYSDSRIYVVATLQYAAAIPDDAQFIVTFLNETEDALYYDMHFEGPKKDEQGNVIGYGEFEPEKGSVSLSFKFKQNQLSDDLGAEEAGDVTVVHVNDGGGEEVLDASVSLDGSTDKVTFTTDSFSTYKFVVDQSSPNQTNPNSTENQKNTWNNGETNTYTYAGGDVVREQGYYRNIDNITKDLGSALDYSIYSNYLRSDAHLEGNIAVGEYHVNDPSSNLNQDEAFIRGAGLKELHIVKIVDGGPEKDVNFNFSLTDNKGNVIAKFTIAAKGSGDTVDVDVLSGNVALTDAAGNSVDPGVIKDALNQGTIFLNELDEDGNPIDNGAIFEKGDYSYTVSYSSEDADSNINNHNQISSTGVNNLIGNINTNQDKFTVANYFGKYGVMTYFDDANIARDDNGNLKIEMTQADTIKITFNTSNGEKVVSFNVDSSSDTRDPANFVTTKESLTQTINDKLNELGQLSARLAKEANGPAAGNGNSDPGEVNFINLTSVHGDLTEDLAAANFDLASEEWVSGLLSQDDESLGNDQYLIINIDCTGKDKYILSGLTIDKFSFNGSYDKLPSHIVYNFVKRVGNQFTAYDGDIYIHDISGGTILAPKAKVHQGDAEVYNENGGIAAPTSDDDARKTNGLFTGEIIADQVIRFPGQGVSEIHKKTALRG